MSKRLIAELAASQAVRIHLRAIFTANGNDLETVLTRIDETEAIRLATEIVQQQWEGTRGGLPAYRTTKTAVHVELARRRAEIYARQAATTTDQPAATGVIRDVYIPPGIVPEFPCPVVWNGNPVIAGYYIQRRPGRIPLWLAITWDNQGGDAYHLARLTAAGDSIQTHYHVGSTLTLGSERYAKAISLAADEATYRNRMVA